MAYHLTKVSLMGPEWYRDCSTFEWINKFTGERIPDSLYDYDKSTQNMYDDLDYMCTNKYTATPQKSNTEKGEEVMDDKQLYQIKGTETYGYVLATNSQGKKVFEVKGTGEIKTVEPDKLEEVIPYSVAVRFADGGQLYHYWVDEGSVEVGDILYIEGQTGGKTPFCSVEKVDTKSRVANKRFVGVKFNTTKL